MFYTSISITAVELLIPPPVISEKSSLGGSLLFSSERAGGVGAMRLHSIAPVLRAILRQSALANIRRETGVTCL